MEDNLHSLSSDDAGVQVTAPTAPRVTGHSRPLASLSDDDLLRRLADILAESHRVETDLVAHIAEVDERRLYAREAFPSMFAYCTKALHLSESEAYLRIAAARASREHPVILAMLGDGRLHLTGIALLAPHLTRENRDTLLRRATHLSKRGIEDLVAEVAPQADVPVLIRKVRDRTMPTARTSTLSGMGNSVTQSPPQVPGVPQLDRVPVRPESPPVLQPLSPGRYKVQFTANAQLRGKLERLQDLMRSQIPDGDLAAVIEAAVTEKLERLEARRFASTSRPRKQVADTDTSPDSRDVPAAVRRAVRERDGNQCRFVDASGHRCEERRHLEYHHVHPFGMGGDHRPENVKLICKQHNDYLAECDYGRGGIGRFRHAGRRVIEGGRRAGGHAGRATQEAS